MKFTSSQPSRTHYNPTIIYFYQREQKPNSIHQSFARQTPDMLHSSNFVRLFHHQSFTLYGIMIVIICCNYDYLATQQVKTVLHENASLASIFLQDLQDLALNHT